MHFDFVVIGAGPAGLSAAAYGASEELSTLVVDEGGLGGQAKLRVRLSATTSAFPRGVSSRRLALQAHEQAWVLRANFAFMQKVTELRREPDGIFVTLSDSGRLLTRAVLLATGVSYRRLGIPEIEALRGASVFYCGPASEAPAAGQDVYVLRGRELGWTGCGAPRSLCPARHARATCSVARRWDVALSGASGEGHAERAGPSRDGDRRRRG
jgi:thioredoxin reductase (NADPH)